MLSQLVPFLDDPFTNRSTRGASKQRRDQMNGEIHLLRELLPLSENTRERLFQLQVMSLTCIFIRKELYTRQVCLSPSPSPLRPSEVLRSLRSFLLLSTHDGRLLYISENASDYLGHSVEELMCQGDSLLDVVDPRDLPMSLNRSVKRHTPYQKYLLVSGNRVVSPSGEVLLAAQVTPLLNPDTVPSLLSGNSLLFSSKLSLDLHIREFSSLLFDHLSVAKSCPSDSSFYSLVHPSDAMQLSTKHRLLITESSPSVMLLLRLLNPTGDFSPFHIVLSLISRSPPLLPLLQSQEGSPPPTDATHFISVSFQALTHCEWEGLRKSSWIYIPPPSFSSPSLHLSRPLTPTSPCEEQPRNLPHPSPSLLPSTVPTLSRTVPPTIRSPISLTVLPTVLTPLTPPPSLSPNRLVSSLILPPLLPDLGAQIDEFFKEVESVSVTSSSPSPPSSLSSISSFTHHFN